MPLQLDFDVLPGIVFLSRGEWQSVEKIYVVLTDGSKMDFGTGAGVFIMDSEIKGCYRLALEHVPGRNSRYHKSQGWLEHTLLLVLR